MKFRLLLILCCITALGGSLITACKPRPASDKPKVFATIEPLRFFAEQIAGDHLQIQSMVPKGSSPETYDPTPQQLMELAESSAYLSIGNLGFEQQWIPKLKENAPKVIFCDTSEELNYIGQDPHTWTTPSNALIIAKNICKMFCSLDSAHQKEYTQNCAKLMTLIQKTDAEVRKVVEQGIQTTFAIYHPTLTYFAHDYGLEQLCIEEEGKEPSPAQLKTFIKQCKSAKVKVIFIQKEFNTKNAEIIAKETGARLVSINPLSYDWQEEIIHITNALKK